MVKPSVPWVCAPHQSSGTGGTTWAASSFLTRMLPTCGPLPWVTTSSWPAATSRGGRPHRDADGLDLGRRGGAAVGAGHRVAAQGEQDPHSGHLLASRSVGRWCPVSTLGAGSAHGRCQDLPNTRMPFGNVVPRRRAGGTRPARRARPARSRCARRGAAGGGARYAHRQRRCRRSGSAARGSRWCRATGGRPRRPGPETGSAPSRRPGRGCAPHRPGCRSRRAAPSARRAGCRRRSRRAAR